MVASGCKWQLVVVGGGLVRRDGFKRLQKGVSGVKRMLINNEKSLKWCSCAIIDAEDASLEGC